MGTGQNQSRVGRKKGAEGHVEEGGARQCAPDVTSALLPVACREAVGQVSRKLRSWATHADATPNAVWHQQQEHERMSGRYIKK